MILDPARRVNGLADSKMLTPERREVLAARIKERAIAWAVAHASVEEIDRINILRASRSRCAARSMRSFAGPVKPGSMATCARIRRARRAIVDGDATHKPISPPPSSPRRRATPRCALHDRFPLYGFDQHKGYATAEHLEAVGRHGPARSTAELLRCRCIFSGNPVWRGLGNDGRIARIRSYRLYCEAMKLANGAKELADFEYRAKRLKREYADVFASRDAASHVELVRALLRDARSQLRAK